MRTKLDELDRAMINWV